MNNKTVMYSVLSFSLSVAAVCGVFMTFSKALKYENSPSFDVISWMVVCCLTAFLIFTFAFKNRFSKRMKVRTKSHVFTGALGVFLSGGLAIYGITPLLRAAVSGADIQDGSRVRLSDALIPSATDKGSLYFLNIIFVAALAGTAVYFSLCLFSEREKKGTFFAAFSLFPGVALAIKLVCDFLSQNINGYSKLYNFHLLSLAFFLLFFVNESRIYLRKSAPALYVFFGAAGCMTAIVYMVPSLIYRFGGINCVDSTVAAANPLYVFTDLLTVVYVYVKLFTLGFRESGEPHGESAPAVVFDGNDTK